jgi:ABC-2 type transport system ATP-binding protein
MPEPLSAVPQQAADTAVALTVRELSRDFPGVRAVDRLSFTAGRGEIIGLLGHNGAGKTTTIRMLNGLLQPSEGTASVLGLDPATQGPEVRARTGVLTETPSVDERLTARENLRFAARLAGVMRDEADGRVAELLERFRLSDRADDRVAGFSRGMKQRLALARALLHDPEVLFLDEPTAALDPVAARDVHDLVRRSASEHARTVVVTTHNLVEAQRLCDTVIILRRGREIASGTPASISARLAGAGDVEVEVGPGEANRAAELARAALPDTGAETDGRVMTLTGVGTERVPALTRALVEGGVSVYRVTPREASLEDAYFALHAEEAGR